MPSRRKARSMPGRVGLPPEVPEAAKADQPAPETAQPDADLLPDDLRKMLEAAYT
jgi:hypothetical protein